MLHMHATTVSALMLFESLLVPMCLQCIWSIICCWSNLLILKRENFAANFTFTCWRAIKDNEFSDRMPNLRTFYFCGFFLFIMYYHLPTSVISYWFVMICYRDSGVALTHVRFSIRNISIRLLLNRYHLLYFYRSFAPPVFIHGILLQL